MRADRLVSLVLLLRRRGRMSAPELARELEVSTRTVLRDVEALSGAGVPVYAERGRRGGFALLPGLRTELTGLNRDEAVALLAVGSGRAGSALGSVLGSVLASAVRKVADALPETDQVTADDAARRFLLDPPTDLLSRRLAVDGVPTATMAAVRAAVLSGRRLRIHYAATGQEPRWRTVDPIGLVTAGAHTYLLATRSGADRTYRLSRLLAAEELPEPAVRPRDVDLDALWRERCARFLAGGDHVLAQVLVVPSRRDTLAGTALAVRAEGIEPDGRLRLQVTYQDTRHAAWALWQLGADAEVRTPPELRAAVGARAAAMAARYAPG